jgi:hypothetical protein
MGFNDHSINVGRAFFPWNQANPQHVILFDEVKVKLSLDLIKYHATKKYGEADV